MGYLLFGTFFAFLGLKLSGAVDWSWWAVVSPVLLYDFIWLLVFLIVGAALASARKVDVKYTRSAKRRGIL